MVFDFLKKKKSESTTLETPPPPLNGQQEVEEREELPSFSAKTKLPEFPELPEEESPIPPEDLGGEKEEETPPPPEFLQEPKRRIEQKEVITKPVYVKVDRYRAIMERIDAMINNFKESEESLISLTELKNDEDVQYERWRDEIEQIEKKLVFVDKILFETKGG